MASLFDVYEMDGNREKVEGVTLDIGDVQINILRAGGANRKFANVSRREYRKHQHAIDAGLMGEEDSAKMLAEIYADSIIIGWEGVTDRDGNELECNRDNVVFLLTELPELFAEIREQATNVDSFRLKQLEDDAGN